jgi:DNA-binding MarR family transcriptional regulator
MSDDVIRDLERSLRRREPHRPSPVQYLRLTVLELLVRGAVLHGHSSVARTLHYDMEAPAGADSWQITAINNHISCLEKRGRVRVERRGAMIWRVELTDSGLATLRQLLELERDDYPAFLSAISDL